MKEDDDMGNNNSHLIPIINKKLTDNFCIQGIMNNPRTSELNNVLIRLAERFGSIIEDMTAPSYREQINERAYYLLYMANVINVVDRNIEVDLPEIRNENCYKKETIKYELAANGYLKRTHTITERTKTNERIRVSVSLMNEDGLEMQRITDIRDSKSGAETKVYERLKSNPNIIRKTRDGQNDEEFYDIRAAKNFANLGTKNGTRIQKEQIRDLTIGERESILNNCKDSVYINGINKILGKAKIKPADTGR